MKVMRAPWKLKSTPLREDVPENLGAYEKEL